AGAGARVVVETGAARGAGFTDAEFEGAELADRGRVLAATDVLLTVQPPAPADVDQLRPGSVVIGFLKPHAHKDLLRALCARNVTGFAMELVPRISRAQSMDALSSQAAVAGYKAVLIGAAALD